VPPFSLAVIVHHRHELGPGNGSLGWHIAGLANDGVPKLASLSVGGRVRKHAELGHNLLETRHLARETIGLGANFCSHSASALAERGIVSGGHVVLRDHRAGGRSGRDRIWLHKTYPGIEIGV
jgi:hypothetical protein